MDLDWKRLGLPPSEMQSVLVDQEVWRFSLDLLPRNLSGHAGEEKRRKRYYSSPAY